MDNKKALIILIVALVVIAAGTVIFLITGKIRQNEFYKVTFVTDNGSVIVTQKVEQGGKVVMPQTPTKDGYVFVGWLYQEIPYDFSSAVKANMTLKAEWQELKEDVVTYIVSFNSDGGTTVENQIVKKDAKAVKPADPTKDGYTFNGWILNNVVYNFENKITEDIQLKASWKKDKATNNTTTKPSSSSSSSKNQKTEPSNSKVSLATPTLTEGGRGGDPDSIGVLLKLNSISIERITGIEIYRATSKDGKYTLLKTVKKEDWNNETATVYAMNGEHLYFKVRTYVKNTAGTFYSGYSNVMELNNTN